MINKKHILKVLLLSTYCILLPLHASDIVSVNGDQWQNTSENKELRKNWKGAVKYCETLSLGGYSDWVLPTVEQLQSLVDLTKYRPAVIDGISEISVLTFYWSSTPFTEDKKKAWHVFYKYGESYYTSKGEKFGVRCVREKP